MDPPPRDEAAAGTDNNDQFVCCTTCITGLSLGLSRKADHMARFLILLGLVILAIGLLWPILSRLGLGRLPGDIVIQRDNFTFYFPLATCILISVVLSVVFWLFNR
jgi:hypothetical protein